jgi:hypothetical protein
MSLPASAFACCACVLALATGCGGGGSPAPPANVSGQVLRSFSLLIEPDRIRSGAACAAAIEAIRTCIGFINVPPPEHVIVPAPLVPLEVFAAPFRDRTGLASLGPVYASRNPEPASDSFVQLADPRTFGIHLDTRSRGTAFLSNINPLFQFERFEPAPGAFDARLTPWLGPDARNVEIAFSFDLRVKRVTAAPGSMAYGHPTFDLWDRKSNIHFYFIVMAFGTVPLIDNILWDDASGKVIVQTAFRQSPYGRNFGAGPFATPSPWVAPAPEGVGGHYEFRFNVEEFRRILAAARTLEPALSADPADYIFDDFHFNTEIGGDGEIGETLANIEVRVLIR